MGSSLILASLPLAIGIVMLGLGLSLQGEASRDPVVQVYGRQAWGLHQWDIGNIGEALRCFSENNPALLDGVVFAHSETPIRRDVSGEWPGWHAVVTALHGDVGTAQTIIDKGDGPDDAYAVATWAYCTAIIASMVGDAGWVLRMIDRWMTVGTGRAAVQQEHYIRLIWYWARALDGDDPAGIAAETDQILAGTLVDPPRREVARRTLNALSARCSSGAASSSRRGRPARCPRRLSTTAARFMGERRGACPAR
ncbi:hypothetical protein [Nonomuraea gerenzanensis]|uniref:hypothetical protein n=1 Tax=Nonomuraea gerenzanensis TaxID=93944 RepID=UPI001CDA14DE|nr:hypothetical protein [Nonomuraea gerenzanensis]UBU11512.1 hypothetical protein LCN96_45550 [Nonomuraea gerenzanensis]